MTEKEKEIQKHMQVLGLTREEAEQLWEEDNSDEITPEVAEMEKKAKELKRRYEGNQKGKISTKERKVDEEKKFLIDEIVGIVAKVGTIQNIQTETEIAFSYNGNDYTFKLTKHRKKK